ncbi:SOS response associated peptidase (SRAP) [Nitrosospira multiformis]|uniref:Abasic site processing protein n=2 Tax=Nitrosospira multiformis TaxID=1231 RepID=A0A1I0BGX5_9PROT|nr:SOS response associated peptidase (SRAP) [Nitrosospira multiformis]
MEKRNWKSRDTLNKARRELLEKEFIIMSRAGDLKRPTLYALTFFAIDECGGKLDINATERPLSLWRLHEPLPPFKINAVTRSASQKAVNSTCNVGHKTPNMEYRTPKEAQDRKRPWINARVEKALTGSYFRHMFRQGRVIIPGGGRFEWTLEQGRKQPWYISRRDKKPIFMAGITNFRPGIQQSVEVGFVIVTEDSGSGMVDIHDRRPVVLEPEDAWRWMDPDTPVEEAAHIAQSRSLPSEVFTWWKVGRHSIVQVQTTT